ncbi:MAG: hypothetical protein ACR2OW_10760 [Methyloligellaceae bacterium]
MPVITFIMIIQLLGGSAGTLVAPGFNSEASCQTQATIVVNQLKSKMQADGIENPEITFHCRKIIPGTDV